MITIYLIFSACLLMNVLMIFYTQKQMKRKPAVFRIRVQPTEEEILANLQQLSEYARQEDRENVNWNREGF